MPPAERRNLLFILLLALVVRVVRVLFFMPVIEADGAEYVRIAENLLGGRGYIGLIPGPELMLPPLLSWTIAGVSFVTGGDLIVAGRVVAVVAGVLLVLAVHAITRAAAGAVAARWAALLAALLPAFVLSGTAIFSEGLQLALVAFGLVFAMRAASSREVRPAALAGLLFGLAYLARVESLALAGLVFVLLVTGYPRRGAPARSSLPAAAAFAIALVIAMSPYPIYLHGETGQWRLEGKSERVAATVARSAEGRSYGAANYELGPEGEELGPWLSPSEVYDGPGFVARLLEHPRPILAQTATNLRQLAKMIATGHTLLSPLFLAAFVLVAFAPGRSRAARFLDLFLLLLAAYTIALGGLYKVFLRYFVALALPAAIGGGRGVAEFVRRLEARRGRPVAAWIPVVAVLVLVLSVARGAFTGFREYDECTAAHRSVISLGRLMRADGAPGTVLGDDSRIAFYGGRDWEPLPLAPTLESLLQHAAARGARYLNFRKDGDRPGPWLDPNDLPAALVEVGRDGRNVLVRVR